MARHRAPDRQRRTAAPAAVAVLDERRPGSQHGHHRSGGSHRRGRHAAPAPASAAVRSSPEATTAPAPAAGRRLEVAGTEQAVAVLPSRELPPRETPPPETPLLETALLETALLETPGPARMPEPEAAAPGPATTAGQAGRHRQLRPHAVLLETLAWGGLAAVVATGVIAASDTSLGEAAIWSAGMSAILLVAVALLTLTGTSMEHLGIDAKNGDADADESGSAVPVDSAAEPTRHRAA